MYNCEAFIPINFNAFINLITRISLIRFKQRLNIAYLELF